MEEKNKKSESKTGSNKNETLSKEQQRDMARFSQDLANRIYKANTKARGKRKGIFSRVNPLVFLVSGFIILFVFFGFLNNANSSSSEVLSVGELVEGINNDRFAEIIINDDGSIEVVENNVFIFPDSQEIDLPEEINLYKDAKSVSFEELFENNLEESLVDQIRAFFGAETSGITNIYIGENRIFAIGSDSDGNNLYIIEESNQKALQDYTEENGINLSDLGITVKELDIYSEEISARSLESRIDNEQIENVLLLGDLTLAELKQDSQNRYNVDWSPSIPSFTALLDQEEISVNQENVKFVTNSVPASIGLSDILTAITIIVFIVLAFIIFRGAQASGMGVVQFGQSKARMFFGQKTDVSFSDVAGINEARDELNEIVDFLKNPGKYRKLGARIPKGILMFGAPGTGKTLLARAIAGEAGVPFFHTSGSEFEEMLVGAGASRVRDLFAKAKKAAPALIFIDEIDAVARKRGTRIQSGSTEQTLNQILVEMDGFEKNTNVIVIAATNRPDVLDPAILRPGRFDRQVRIELPDKDGRFEILKIHGKNKPFAKEVDLERIAKRTVGFSGADLENILNEAAIISAASNKKEITSDDLDEAVSKVMIGPAKRSKKRTEKELKLVAYHEAGHALVAKMTPNSTPVDKISIVSRGGTGGVTMFLPEKDESIISRGKLYADIVVSLGGRAAEELVLDDISTGASNDIEKATRVAKSMIQKFGMNDKLGLIQYGQSMDSQFLGYHYGDTKDFSEKTAELIDDEVRTVISKAYADAKKAITENRAKLDEIANILLEKEVMDKEDFDKLFN